MDLSGLRRHRLVRLNAAGWSNVLKQPWDAQAYACLSHWAVHRLPLVMARQPAEAVALQQLALGLPAPAEWDRRRFAVQVPLSAVHGLDDFPRLADLHTLPPDLLIDLTSQLHASGNPAVRVFGSHGWQAITGLTHVRPASDLDLCITVDGVDQADAVAQRLQALGDTTPRIDGELVFTDGAAVAWREWAAWRAGRVRSILVKRLGGVALQRDVAWCGGAVDKAAAP